MAYNRLEKLQSRRVDPSIRTSQLNEVYKYIQENDAIKYAIGAMQPIDPEYTRNTFKECARIENQLDGKVPAEFDHQGSVTNDTHIKAHSDIDLLVAHTDFCTIEPPNTPTSRYSGNSISELVRLRNNSTTVIENAFPEVDIDKTGSKSVCLTGGSLRRKIDMVICNWWHTTDYVKTGHNFYKGIQVLDISIPTRISNKPFLHNALIEVKDDNSNGNLRKLVRLLKSLKYDSERNDCLSSYDICSVVYNMDENLLSCPKGQELLLMQRCNEYLLDLIRNDQKRSWLWVPNRTRLVFCAEGASLSQLKVMQYLLQELLNEIEQGLSRSFKKLAEARVDY